VNLSVLGDAVRAVHLVGPGGQEWWIEGNAGAGDSSRHSQLPDWCHDTIVVRDTDFLQSVIVGVGRFGIVYSMILEVEPQYTMEEESIETTWSTIRTDLLIAVANGYTTPGGLFSASRFPCGQIARDLEKLKTEPTTEKFDPETKEWVEVSVTAAMVAEKQKDLDYCLEQVAKYGPLALEGLRRIASGSRALETRRWITTNKSAGEPAKSVELFDFLCTNEVWTVA
jgi:hypothetical protein